MLKTAVAAALAALILAAVAPTARPCRWRRSHHDRRPQQRHPGRPVAALLARPLGTPPLPDLLARPLGARPLPLTPRCARHLDRSCRRSAAVMCCGATRRDFAKLRLSNESYVVCKLSQKRGILPK